MDVRDAANTAQGVRSDSLSSKFMRPRGARQRRKVYDDSAATALADFGASKSDNPHSQTLSV
jgi:hypothetical protein